MPLVCSSTNGASFIGQGFIQVRVELQRSHNFLQAPSTALVCLLSQMSMFWASFGVDAEKQAPDQPRSPRWLQGVSMKLATWFWHQTPASGTGSGGGNKPPIVKAVAAQEPNDGAKASTTSC
jgi:hypothetical protein